MKKLWMGLSIILALSLVWCAIPAFGGWSWAADPEFLIKGEDSDEVTLNVDIQVDFSGDPDQFDPQKVRVVLEVPDDTDVEVLDDGGFKVKVKDDYDEGEAKLEVVVKEQWRDEYSLRKVTVERDGSKIKAEKKEPYKWVFKFELP